MYTMRALFIGRFQPFHNGHLKVIQNALKKYDKVIIGIGSSQYGHNIDNPFTADERKLMISKSLEKIGIKNIDIVLIPDLHNPPKWVEHVLSIFSEFDVVISNNSLTKRLFSEKGFKVNETSLYNKNEFSGKEIRRRIVNNEQWENLVPQGVVKIINELNGVKRIVELSKH